jgi:hypothetical protein
MLSNLDNPAGSQIEDRVHNHQQEVHPNNAFQQIKDSRQLIIRQKVSLFRAVIVEGDIKKVNAVWTALSVFVAVQWAITQTVVLPETHVRWHLRTTRLHSHLPQAEYTHLKNNSSGLVMLNKAVQPWYIHHIRHIHHPILPCLEKITL